MYSKYFDVFIVLILLICWENVFKDVGIWNNSNENYMDIMMGI